MPPLSPADLGIGRLFWRIREAVVVAEVASGRIVLWNPAAEAIFGYTAAEALGLPVEILVPARLRGRHRAGLARYRETGRGPLIESGAPVELTALRKTGEEVAIELTLAPLDEAAAEGRFVLAMVRDASERKRAEEARLELAQEQAARAASEMAAEQLRRLLAITDAALAHLDPDELLHELLERIRALLEVDTVAVLLCEGEDLVACAAKGLEEEVERHVRIPLGRGFAGRVAAERRAIELDDVDQAEVLSPVLREKGVASLLGVPLLAHGQVLGVLHVGSLRPRRFTGDERLLLQLVADRAALAIEHARAYEGERRARAEAERALRQRDEFLSLAAHELKTPLTPLQAYAALLLRELQGDKATDPDRLRRGLGTIERQARRLARLVARLLDATRLEAGELVLEREEVDLAHLAEEVAAMLRPISARHRIVLRAPEPVLARVDALRLEQVLVDLLDNAIKYGPPDGEITLEVDRLAPGAARLAVTDRGPGIAPEHRQRVFGRFEQAQRGRPIGGLGLGLYLARRVVEQHGGRIDLESPLGGGARFVLTLPTEADAQFP